MKRIHPIVLAILVLALSTTALDAATFPLLVVSAGTAQVLKYNSNGTFNSVFAGVSNANGITEGPDGDIYVTRFGGTNGIFRYDQNGNAVAFGAISTTGTADGLVTAAFAPDGWLYYTSTSKIFRAQGPTMGSPGTIDSTFSITGPVGGSVRGITILPDASTSGYLILFADRKVYYQHPDGSGSGNYTSPGDGSLLVGVHVRSDGDVFTPGYNSPSFATDAVYFGNASPPGGALTTFASPIATSSDFLVDNIFDAAGNVYISDLTANKVLEYNSTGTLIGTFVTAGSGGFSSPTFMTFLAPVPEPTSLGLLGVGGALLLSRRGRTNV